MFNTEILVPSQYAIKNLEMELSFPPYKGLHFQDFKYGKDYWVTSVKYNVKEDVFKVTLDMALRVNRI